MPDGAAPTRRRWLASTALGTAALGALRVPPSASADVAPGDAVSGPAPEPLASLVRDMAVADKVGQLFVTYAFGDRADTADPADVAENRKRHGVDNAQQLIDRYRLGGIVYFTWSRNLRQPTQIAELSNGLQRAALGRPGGIPLLISIDQEQGVVNRLGALATQFPGAMPLGAGGSFGDALTAARITGSELRALGVNQNYAPVADVNVNPANPVIGVRSFGADPALAARLTAAQVRGYQEPAPHGAGVAATAKHFPGHGDTAVDSHYGLPLITHTREQWERIDALPFRAAIKAGVDVIMTAHIVVPALDPAGDPATLSRPILTGLLREHLGYDGVVITDALDMAGVRQKYGDERVPVLAIKAGADMLLMPPDLDIAYRSVLAAVRSGEISQARLDESVLRILRLKAKRGLFADPYVDPGAAPGRVATPRHLAAAQRVADRTVTLIKDDARLLPLPPGPGRRVLVVGADENATGVLAGAVGRRGPSTTPLATGARPGQDRIDAAAAAARVHDLVVVATNRAWQVEEQQRLVGALLGTGRPVVVIAVRDPYDIAYFTGAPTYLATYSFSPPSLEAAARVLFGECEPTGRLPVPIPVAGQPDRTLYPYGHGLGYGG
ncbi:beta-N-acetylhexosaminidase [Carbonactinospora thermoautotrophica]|uniref:beta-N-acetylhexosaminidase n=3 Tax=Carbonactinospora thermoautotrophica TaxID=1469144 RepID=A0A132N6E5_9ACTN|nr:glycoside hydrolase family 3 protein [Carbonactinospora thermoautotrophica]KWX01306.1 Beta-N-acetylhexosaminidase [Carbonactinospora thermoautotrophica]KWX05731.1 beta-N-acetylhexosaminidase [Carbonactinospora thermoautotrophica]